MFILREPRNIILSFSRREVSVRKARIDGHVNIQTCEVYTQCHVIVRELSFRTRTFRQTGYYQRLGKPKTKIS